VKNNTNSRIIGGLPAHINQFPCIAAINVEAPGMTWFCGGCLYGNQWLITAAQCVDGYVLNKY
jgi:secreted trypsin-like serine protease